MIKVYDTVWIMANNQPTKKKVFAVIESMSYFKTGTEYYYRLVEGTCGTGWGNNEGTMYGKEDVFKSKEKLLDSLC